MPLYLTGCGGLSITIGENSSTTASDTTGTDTTTDSSDEDTTTDSSDENTTTDESSDEELSGESSTSEEEEELSTDDQEGEGSTDEETSSDGSSSDDGSSVEEDDEEEPDDDPYYKQPSSYKASATTENLNLNTVLSSYSKVPMPSTGNSKILVIPVEYSDYQFDNGYETMLQNAFFGKAENTDWQSVSSYYYESSNGLLNIEGAVSPKVSIDMTLAEAKSGTATTVSNSVLSSALTTLSSSIELSDYDSNGDGYIDAVWLVNSAPYSSSYSISWAFTYWFTDSSTTFDGMKANSYAWASIEFLERYVIDTTVSYGYNADCHTMIHETGHLLGLDDYYSYDYDGSSPAGRVDMMDANVGDHMAYSKYLLGWIEPTVLTTKYLESVNNQVVIYPPENSENTAYILPIQSEGKKADFNNTPFDEYLMIEFYTPTGLNERDSEYSYSRTTKEYTKPGVLVYHVNSRIGKLSLSNGELVWDGCVYDKLGNKDYEPRWGSTYIYSYIYSNTASYCYDTNFADSEENFYQGRLVSLLTQTEEKTKTTYFGQNDFLFTSGTTFMLDDGKYQNFVFDNSSKPLYGFDVGNVSTESATLTFYKN